MNVVTKTDIKNGLEKIGLHSGDTVMVHTSLSKIGYVCGGAQTVIEALIETVGPEGTIMMPTQSWKNLDPETGVHWEVEEKDWNLIRENWPAYDKAISMANGNQNYAPAFMIKKATLLHAQKKYAEEAAIYQEIMDKYPIYDQQYGVNAEKYVERANALAGK